MIGWWKRLTGRRSAAILLSSAIVAAMAFLLRFLGYIEKRTLAHFFGTTDQIDAFFVALQIALLAHFFLRGILKISVLPALIEARNRSLEDARRLGFTAFLGTGVIGGIYAAVGMALPEQLVGLVAPGFEGEKLALCTRLTFLLLPVSLLLTPAYLMALSLEARRQFAVSTFGDSLQKLVFLPLLILAAVAGSFVLIVPAWYASALAMLGWYVWHHRHQARGGPLPGFSGMMAGSLAGLSAPLIVGNVVSQFGRLVQTKYASLLPDGSVAALKYCQALIDLPLLLVPVSLSFVLYPWFCDMADRREVGQLASWVKSATRFLVLLFVPAAVLLVLCREEVVRVLFGGGAFDSDSVRLTAAGIASLAPGLPAMAVETVVMTYLFARRRMMLAVVVGAVSTLAAAATIPLLSSAWGIAGVASFGATSKIIKVLILIPVLRRSGVDFSVSALTGFALRVLLAASACGAAAVLLLAAVPFASDTLAHTLLRLGIAGGGGLLAWTIAVWLLGFPEFRLIVQSARRLLRCGGAGQPAGSATASATPSSKSGDSSR